MITVKTDTKGRQLKILFVADVSMAGIIGGAERVLFEQATRLVRRGHDVHVLTRKLATHDAVQEAIHGAVEWRYALNDKGAARFFLSSRHNSRRLFEKLHARYRFDVINCHQPFSAFGVLQSRKSKTAKKIYTCHSLSFEEFVSRNPVPAGLMKTLFYQLQTIARRKIERRVIERSDGVVVLSRFTQEKLAGTYGIPDAKVTVIPGGVDLERFHPVENKNMIRHRFNLPVSKIVLFTVRNLVPRMGLENLIDAVKLAAGNAPELYLVIGGAGPLREELEAQADELNIKEFVRLAGFIPEELLPDYYRMADFFILPTKELEGFGLVTLEALASGLPVLGTPVGGTSEILGKFDSSYLFRDVTPASMAELISKKYRLIKERPHEWDAVSRACRRLVEDHYSWDRHISALEKLF